MDVVIEADELARLLEGPTPPALLDVRWQLGDPHGSAHYLLGHLPGAVYVDLENELAGPPSRSEGRHPVPAVPDLERAARRWGLRRGAEVVAYDDVGGTSAARVWWLLRWAGVPRVRLLDGGLGAWTRAGYPLQTGEVVPEPGDVELSGGHLPVLDADGAANVAVDGVLLDARAAERYRGDVEPVDRRAGHIPGAVSAPTVDNVTAAGLFLPADELRSRFAALGVDAGRRVGVYCGSGVTAAHEVAALAIAGIDAVLYPGSWSQWSADPDRLAATGP